ncbi:MAG: hypothetical protein JWO36_2425 [Myxococcales bacterium]|nr:hypothetical protein [Myxococcales bacterium]
MGVGFGALVAVAFATLVWGLVPSRGSGRGDQVPTAVATEQREQRLRQKPPLSSGARILTAVLIALGALVVGFVVWLIFVGSSMGFDNNH